MELKHSFTVPAPLDRTWAAFNDLEDIAPCFPGAALTSYEGDEFAGTVKVKLGPVALQYSGTGRFVERDEAAGRARFEAKGKDKRGNGTAAAKVLAQLTAQGDDTLVEVTTDLAVTGKPAQFGRGLMQDVSDKLLGRFTACLAEKLAGPAAEPEAAAAPTDTEQAAATTAVAPAAAEPVPAPEQPPVRAVPPPAADDESLDLFRTVAPVLVKRYALPVGGALLVGALLFSLVRRLVRR